MSNVQTVQDVYAAYARGDIQAVLARLAENVEWENVGGSTDVPWLIPRSGHAGVARFFEAIGLLQVHHFEPKTYLEFENLVLVLVDEDITVKATGRRLQERDQVHLWTFDERGKVSRHRQRLDTHMNWIAFHDHGSRAARP